MRDSSHRQWTTTPLSFRLLGSTTVASAEGEIEVHGAVRRRLLCRLLIAANRPVPIDLLKEDLWEGELPASAASTLKSHVSLLRRLLGSERLVARDGAYLIYVAPGELDTDVFEAEAAKGRSMLEDLRFEEAAELLGQALARWQGPALADVATTSWGEPEAVRLEELRAAATEGWLGARLARGETGALIADAEAAVASQPLREGLWAKLITALYLSGRQADALRTYQRLRELLGDELGIAPSRELVLLEAAILRQDPALDAASLAPPAGAEPARPRAESERQAANNLPRELTSFVDRPAELSAVRELLAHPGVATLVGAGGTGKTRLALKAAAEVAEEFDGVWLCELAPVSDPTEAARAIAASISSADRAGADLVTTVAERLADGRNLLILDNCEHLVDAVAPLAERFVTAAPQLVLLATSRSPLGVSGEAVHRVPSMSVPALDESNAGTAGSDPDALMRCESVRLFVERARSQQPQFTLDDSNKQAIAAICVRLDGIPLALELAAARLRSISASEIERRLDDRFALLNKGLRTAPARQRTLEGLIDWSYDLLSGAEKDVFGRLAVFAGGFELTAAEDVASSGGVDRHEVLDLLASLIDKSLVQVDTNGVTARYRMLETVRAYALDHLPAGAARQARAAHSAHFLRLAEAAAPHMVGEQQVAWRARLEEDDDNLYVALSNLVAGGPETAVEAWRFGAAVARFWNSRGYYGSEVDLLIAALDISGPTEDAAAAARGAALAAAGYLMFRRGDGSRALAYLEEATRIADETSSPGLRADAKRTLAWVAFRRGELENASLLARQAVEDAIASGDRHLMARAYDVAATTQQSDPAMARRDHAEALRYCKAGGDTLGQASALNNLAVLDVEQGNYEAAREHLVEALALAGQVRDAALLPFLEYGVGLASCLEGDVAAARAAFANALRAAWRTGQRSLVAYTILGLAATAAAAAEHEEAAKLLGAAEAGFDELGEQPEHLEASLFDRTAGELRASLGEGFEEAFSAGRLSGLTNAAAPLVGGAGACSNAGTYTAVERAGQEGR
jgi:predicted ATPase/DNA-binding SARP family transcriptional activator